MVKLYTKNTWQDEILAGDERYNILADDGTPISSDVQIQLSTGVAQPGTALDAARMNNIEDGLDAVDTRLDAVDTRLDNLERMDLNELTAAADGDLLAIVDDPAGTPETKKITLANLRAAIAGAAAAIAGDFATVGWTDYSAISTVTGWATFSSDKKIFYKRIGKLIYVSFNIVGESNNTATKFTLPYAAASGGPNFFFPIYAINNGVINTSPGMGYVAANQAVANLFTSWSSGAWANSGTKHVQGEFWYQTA
jgi:uncharacterized Zn-binding protein involved in type VI secretion